jgi:hypothetical protein
MLPGISDYRRQLDFSSVSLLDAYPHLSGKQARALVRSARSYQEALWIADSDPRQAWLRLVTAVEAVAPLQRDDPPITRLRAVHPDMADRVAACGDPELIQWVTAQFADQAKSMAKFLFFLRKFGPPPPKRRPRGGDRQNWNFLPDQFKHIYDARSQDLHQGIPIPIQMCAPPFVSDSGIAQERSDLFTPSASKRPLCMHMFAYVVRGAVLSWWRSAAENAGN